jgi:hypothetical protein
LEKILRHSLNEDDDFYFSCKEKHIGFKLSPGVKFFERDYKKRIFFKFDDFEEKSAFN